MTKLEKKLEELDYEIKSIKYKNNKPYMIIYSKSLYYISHLEVHYIYHRDSWAIYHYIDDCGIVTENDIDCINDTLNEKKKDLKILKERE